MPSKPSALVPLLEKRRAARELAEHTLARANLAHDEAARAVQRAERAIEQHRSSRPAAADPSGEISGLSLQRSAAFARRHVDEARRLAERLAAAKRSLAEREAVLARERLALARASADERAIERHEAEQAAARERQRQRREQEALDEQAAARIFARDRSDL